MSPSPQTIAIIGASQDRKKFGNKAVRAYQNAGYCVFPVNPKCEEIEGIKCYKSILDIPENVDLASFYVPPVVGEKVVYDVIQKKVAEVFLNPGSESESIIRKLEKAHIQVIQACSILAVGEDPGRY